MTGAGSLAETVPATVLAMRRSPRVAALLLAASLTSLVGSLWSAAAESHLGVGGGHAGYHADAPHSPFLPAPGEGHADDHDPEASHGKVPPDCHAQRLSSLAVPCPCGCGGPVHATSEMASSPAVPSASAVRGTAAGRLLPGEPSRILCEAPSRALDHVPIA